MITDKKDASCKGCYFWKELKPEGGCGSGKCHRYPPKNTQTNIIYTVTKEDDWCGEFLSRVIEKE